MTKFLYWIVYNFDLGPLGPKVLDLAVRSWLRDVRQAEMVRGRGAGGWLSALHLQPNYDDRL